VSFRANLLPSGLYRRSRNSTGSTLTRSRTITAGQESHPVPKVCVNLQGF
jgi:hypothetical protein